MAARRKVDPEAPVSAGAFEDPVVVVDKDADPKVQVVLDGDFAGMTYEDVLRFTVNGINDAMGDMTLKGASCALTLAMDEVLELTQLHRGDFEAKSTAIKFISKALPYAELDTSSDPGELRLKDLRKTRVK